jgi:hypothetical protein
MGLMTKNMDSLDREDFVCLRVELCSRLSLYGGDMLSETDTFCCQYPEKSVRWRVMID